MSYVKGGRYHADKDDSIVPSQAYGYDWLQSTHDKIWQHPAQIGDTTGKWMIFRSGENVDALWPVLMQSLHQGKLGTSMKAATKNDPGTLICVYTQDWRDIGDIRRVLIELRALGVNERLYYKADEQTLLRISGSIYCSSSGNTITLTSKGKDWYRQTGEKLPQL